MDYNRCERGREEECKAPCYGCSYKHFENIKSRIREQLPQEAKAPFDRMDDEFFSASSRRQGQNRRAYIDRHLKEFLRELLKFKELKFEELNNISTEIEVGEQFLSLKPKYDMAFSVNGIDIFIEFKGYGADTNSILSAITAAQVLKESTKYTNGQNLRYYYIGIITQSDTQGTFHNKNHSSITPYVEWAENKGILKFYSSYDIEKLIDDILRTASENRDQRKT